MSNDRDQEIVKSAIADTGSGLLEFLIGARPARSHRLRRRRHAAGAHQVRRAAASIACRAARPRASRRSGRSRWATKVSSKPSSDRWRNASSSLGRGRSASGDDVRRGHEPAARSRSVESPPRRGHREPITFRSAQPRAAEVLQLGIGAPASRRGRRTQAAAKPPGKRERTRARSANACSSAEAAAPLAPRAGTGERSCCTSPAGFLSRDPKRC